MIKIFSLVASMAGDKAITARYSDGLAEAVTELAQTAGEEVSYERVTGQDFRVDYCLSCSGCFKNGICPLDSRDDMARIKQKILECDLLFLGTPVYFGDMSGLMKSVVDRMSYWAHRYELAGKPAAVFATTDSSYGQETAERLADRMRFTGLLTAHIGHSVKGMNMHPNIYLQNEMLPIWQEAAEKLLDALHSPLSYVTDLDEQSFRVRKSLVRKATKFSEITGVAPWDECIVMKERGILEAGTYAEYLENHKRRTEETS